MIESGFNPIAVSRAEPRACGSSWPRPPAGMVSAWTSGWTSALDAEKATGAAAAYFRDLHAIFGSWTLARRRTTPAR
jgi:hypothetical protein